jgi:hypothetical protein
MLTLKSHPSTSSPLHTSANAVLTAWSFIVMPFRLGPPPLTALMATALLPM